MVSCSYVLLPAGDFIVKRDYHWNVATKRCDYWKDWWTERRRTKWSLKVTLLAWIQYVMTLTIPEWKHSTSSKECRCRLWNIVTHDYQESVTTRQTDRQMPDKMISMCRYYMLCRQHKNETEVCCALCVWSLITIVYHIHRRPSTVQERRERELDHYRSSRVPCIIITKWSFTF